MPLNFSWLVPQRVAGMAQPRAANAPWLAEQGVRALLSLTERPPAGFERFELLHLPIRDMTAPSLELLAESVRFIRDVVARGEAVAVHCTAGMGRTGTVLAAYLVATGLPPEDAIAHVRALRPGSIETPEQEETIHRFARALERQP